MWSRFIKSFIQSFIKRASERSEIPILNSQIHKLVHRFLKLHPDDLATQAWPWTWWFQLNSKLPNFWMNFNFSLCNTDRWLTHSIFALFGLLCTVLHKHSGCVFGSRWAHRELIHYLHCRFYNKHLPNAVKGVLASSHIERCVPPPSIIARLPGRFSHDHWPTQSSPTAYLLIWSEVNFDNVW